MDNGNAKAVPGATGPVGIATGGPVVGNSVRVQLPIWGVAPPVRKGSMVVFSMTTPVSKWAPAAVEPAKLKFVTQGKRRFVMQSVRLSTVTEPSMGIAANAGVLVVEPGVAETRETVAVTADGTSPVGSVADAVLAKNDNVTLSIPTVLVAVTV